MPAFDVARDDMLTAFNDKWVAEAPAVTPNGQAPQVFWDGVGEPDSPITTEPWARAQIRHLLGTTRGIGGLAGSRRRTEKRGTVTIQIFVPVILDGSADPVQVAEDLAIVAKSAFEAVVTSNGVNFRDARINEVGVDGPLYQVNALSDFDYEETV